MAAASEAALEAIAHAPQAAAKRPAAAAIDNNVQREACVQELFGPSDVGSTHWYDLFLAIAYEVTWLRSTSQRSEDGGKTVQVKMFHWKTVLRRVIARWLGGVVAGDAETKPREPKHNKWSRGGVLGPAGQEAARLLAQGLSTAEVARSMGGVDPAQVRRFKRKAVVGDEARQRKAVVADGGNADGGNADGGNADGGNADGGNAGDAWFDQVDRNVNMHVNGNDQPMPVASCPRVSEKAKYATRNAKLASKLPGTLKEIARILGKDKPTNPAHAERVNFFIEQVEAAEAAAAAAVVVPVVVAAEKTAAADDQHHWTTDCEKKKARADDDEDDDDADDDQHHSTTNAECARLLADDDDDPCWRLAEEDDDARLAQVVAETAASGEDFFLFGSAAADADLFV